MRPVVQPFNEQSYGITRNLPGLGADQRYRGAVARCDDAPTIRGGWYCADRRKQPGYRSPSDADPLACLHPMSTSIQVYTGGRDREVAELVLSIQNGEAGLNLSIED